MSGPEPGPAPRRPRPVEQLATDPVELADVAHSYTYDRGYHPLLAVTAGMARLGEGRAKTA